MRETRPASPGSGPGSGYWWDNGAAITGIGAISAIGANPADMLDSLRAARGGISPIESFSTEGLRTHHAGEIRGWQARDHFGADEALRLDRTAQLAVVASRQAVAEAGLTAEVLRSGRVALVFGICAGGIGAPDSPGMLSVAAALDESEDSAGEIAALQRFRDAAVFAQTHAVAADLGITGPCLTISTACAASTSALASALTLLRAGHADIVLAGGADAWSRGTYAGFYGLGAMAENPCSPFSRDTGVTFGEGAGCIVLEAPEAAGARGAQVQGLLLGCGSTADAHHITSPNPGGQGLLRAMKLALQESGLQPAAIGYVNAHGTGTPDNDVAETVAIHRLFEGATPPISSSKSFFGHTLGAAGILEFIASLLAMKAGFLPPTLNFVEARAGCDLDYVPNVARPQLFDQFLSMSAAFGGVNAVAVGARADHVSPAPAPVAARHAVVTGIGVVSPIGCGVEVFREGLRAGTPGIVPITRFDTRGFGCDVAGLVNDFPTRKLAPTADTRRMDMLTRFAVVAATLALKDARLTGKIAPERIGLHVAMSLGPVGSAEIFATELHRHGIAGLGAKFFPPIVFATIGGQVGLSCQLRGASFTFMEGAGAGLQALAHAQAYLRQHPELDAIVVVAADEIARTTFQMQDRLGQLTRAGAPSLYDPSGDGLVPGEGAVAFVVETESAAASRGAASYGRIDGAAFGGEGRADEALDPSGASLAAVAASALDSAGGGAPDLVVALARGTARHDLREAAALRQVLGGNRPPVTSLNGQLGLADATSGLYAAAAALLGLRHGEIYPTMGAGAAMDGLDVVRGEMRAKHCRTALVLGSSQHGNSTALVLGRVD